MIPQTISILGCGWYGLPLAKLLVQKKYIVKGSTTTFNKLENLNSYGIEPYLLNFDSENNSLDTDFFDCDVLIISIPPKRNSADYNFYPQKIKNILSNCSKRAKEIIFISSSSVYGDLNRELNELDNAIPDSAGGELIKKAEQEVLNIKNSTIIRFSGLFGPDRDPARFFTGKINISNGLAPVNLIHQIDAIGITETIINQQAFGRIYNACTPCHPTRIDFYTKAAKKSNLELPKFKEEKELWKIISSVNVPKYLNYNFKELF